MLTLHYLILFSMLYFSVFDLLKIEKDRKVWHINILVVICLLSIEFFIGINELHYHTQPILYDMIYTLVASAVVLYMVKKIKYILMIIILNTFIVVILPVGAAVAFTIMDISISLITESPLYSLIGASAGFVLFMIIYFIIKLMKIAHKARLGIIGMTLLIISIISYGYFLTAHFIGIDNRSDIIVLLSLIGGVLPIIGVIVFIIKDNKLHEIRHREELFIQSFDLQKQHYQTLYFQEENTKKFRHDLKHQLGVLHSLLSQNRLTELKDFLEEMAGETKVINEQQSFQSGSDFVDANLNQILKNCRYENVKFNRDWTIPNNLIFTPIDITSLFMNILTNAFDATIKCKENQFVNVKINSYVDFLYVGIENSYSDNLNIRNGEFISTKNNIKNHGYGIQIIKDIVSKYGGSVTIDYNDKTFLVEMTFGKEIYLKK